MPSRIGTRTVVLCSREAAAETNNSVSAAALAALRIDIRISQLEVSANIYRRQSQGGGVRQCGLSRGCRCPAGPREARSATALPPLRRSPQLFLVERERKPIPAAG